MSFVLDEGVRLKDKFKVKSVHNSTVINIDECEGKFLLVEVFLSEKNLSEFIPLLLLPSSAAVFRFDG